MKIKREDGYEFEVKASGKDIEGNNVYIVKSPIDEGAYIERLELLDMNLPANRVLANAILCDMLVKLGCREVVDAFTEKCYGGEA